MRKGIMMLRKGTLWDEVLRRSEKARASGALVSISTGYEYVEDSGMVFFIRTLSGLQKKEEAKKAQESGEGREKINPFLPYEEELFVSDVSQTHVAILNKFNVVDNHLLIVTRHFEDQETLLTEDDFSALWGCMMEYDSLGFYNGGEEAGASQRHKHLQLVPLPMAPDGPAVPISPLLEAAGPEGRPLRVPGFPFEHLFVRMDQSLINKQGDAAGEMFRLYSDMLRGLAMKTPEKGVLTRQSGPYCLLATAAWMLLVPRSQEFFDSISVNSLGFAGALLVRDDNQMEKVRAFGPMNVLKSVAVPLKDPS